MLYFISRGRRIPTGQSSRRCHLFPRLFPAASSASPHPSVPLTPTQPTIQWLPNPQPGTQEFFLTSPNLILRSFLLLFACYFSQNSPSPWSSQSPNSLVFPSPPAQGSRSPSAEVLFPSILPSPNRCEEISPQPSGLHSDFTYTNRSTEIPVTPLSRIRIPSPPLTPSLNTPTSALTRGAPERPPGPRQRLRNRSPRRRAAEASRTNPSGRGVAVPA